MGIDRFTPKNIGPLGIRSKRPFLVVAGHFCGRGANLSPDSDFPPCGGHEIDRRRLFAATAGALFRGFFGYLFLGDLLFRDFLGYLLFGDLFLRDFLGYLLFGDLFLRDFLGYLLFGDLFLRDFLGYLLLGDLFLRDFLGYLLFGDLFLRDFLGYLLLGNLLLRHFLFLGHGQSSVQGFRASGPFRLAKKKATYLAYPFTRPHIGIFSASRQFRLRLLMRSICDSKEDKFYLKLSIRGTPKRSIHTEKNRILTIL